MTVNTVVVIPSQFHFTQIIQLFCCVNFHYHFTLTVSFLSRRLDSRWIFSEFFIFEAWVPWRLCLRFMASSFAVCYFVLNFFRLHWQMYHGANIILTPFLLYPPWILYLIFEEAAKSETHLSNSFCVDKFLMLNITLKLFEVMPLVFEFGRSSYSRYLYKYEEGSIFCTCWDSMYLLFFSDTCVFPKLA